MRMSSSIVAASAVVSSALATEPPVDAYAGINSADFKPEWRCPLKTAESEQDCVWDSCMASSSSKAPAAGWSIFASTESNKLATLCSDPSSPRYPGAECCQSYTKGCWWYGSRLWCKPRAKAEPKPESSSSTPAATSQAATAVTSIGTSAATSHAQTTSAATSAATSHVYPHAKETSSTSKATVPSATHASAGFPVPSANGTAAAASTSVVAPPAASPVAVDGTPLPKAQVDALLALSAKFTFEVRGGLCAINNLPSAAAAVGWRLVYDLDIHVENKFRFEICEPREHGRVVTKVQGQYVYGLAVSHTVTSTGAVELVCENAGVQRVKVENKQVTIVETKVVKETVITIYQCSNPEQCTKSTCEADKCGANLVAKIEGATPATPATGSAITGVTYEFEVCKSQEECFRVETCVEDECIVEEPAHGSAPAPVPVDQVKIISTGEAAHGTTEKQISCEADSGKKSETQPSQPQNGAVGNVKCSAGYTHSATGACVKTECPAGHTHSATGACVVITGQAKFNNNTVPAAGSPAGAAQIVSQSRPANGTVVSQSQPPAVTAGAGRVGAALHVLAVAGAVALFL
ncbi:hypothetical protein HIM_03122 [Hirsutella minnesotensis 3608]|nr:hypothetical protein HIM_03122 [Hirsutella minnesotensis 3608]